MKYYTKIEQIQFSSVQFIHTYSHDVNYKNRKEKKKGRKQRKSNLHVDWALI